MSGELSEGRNVRGKCRGNYPIDPFILNVHVQTIRHLGMVTINSSSVSDIGPFIHFVTLVSPLLRVSPGAVSTPRTPSDATEITASVLS